MHRLGLVFALALFWCPLPLRAQTRPTDPQNRLRPLMPDMAGFHRLSINATMGQLRVPLPVRLYLPRGYEQRKEPLALLVYLHSDKDRGKDLAALANSGPERFVRQNPQVAERCPFILVAPQCPEDLSWDHPDMAAMVLTLIEETSRQFTVDPERIVLSGSGMGGGLAWRVALASPEQLAGLAISAAPQLPTDGAAERLRYLPCRIAASSQDAPAAAAMDGAVEVLKNAGCDVQFAAVGTTRDECMQQFFADQRLYEWLSQNRRLSQKARQEREAQIAKAAQTSLAALPQAPGLHRLQHSTWVGAQRLQTPYALYLPTDYPQGQQTWPTVIYLGPQEGERQFDANLAQALPAELARNEQFRHRYPFISVIPAYDSSPGRVRALRRLLDDVAARYRLDGQRLYLVGVGAGANQTWRLALEDPQRFAAIAPLCGTEIQAQQLGDKLKYTATWIVSGGADRAATQAAARMATALGAAKANVRHSIVPNADSSVWARYGTDQRFYEWLLGQRLLSAEQRKQFDQQGPPTLASQVSQTPGHQRLQLQLKVGDKTVPMACALYLPAGYGKGPKPAAMVVLHDLADRGTDLPWIVSYGSDPQLRNNSYPLIGIAPICPPDRRWDEPEMARLVAALTEELSAKLQLDPQRIYLTGRASGAAGVWAVMEQHPQPYAMFAMVQPPGVPLDKLNERQRYMRAIIATAGKDQGTVDNAQRMADALAKVSASVDVQNSPDAAKPVWASPWYTDRAFYEPLLNVRCLTAEQRQARDQEFARQQRAGPPTPGLGMRSLIYYLDKQPQELPYMILLPSNYGQSQERYPLVLLLHDNDARGTDGKALANFAPVAALQADAKLRTGLRMIVVAPQCLPDQKWTDDFMKPLLEMLLDQLSGKLRVDTQRIILGGIGAGADATWEWGTAQPQRFAGLMPIQASTWPVHLAEKLRHLGVWIHAPLTDNAAAEAARRMHVGLQGFGAACDLNLAPVIPAPNWQPMFVHPNTYAWLAGQKRLAEAEQKAREETHRQQLTTQVPDKPGHHRFQYKTIVNGKPHEVPYLIYLPEGYDRTDKRWPALVFLHGMGEAQRDLSGQFAHGPAAHLQADAALRQWYPMINIHPIHDNSPEAARWVIHAVDHAIRTLRIDPDRVYLSGFSFGGTSTWTVAMEGPDRFAAIAPLCGRGPEPGRVAERLKYLPTWISVGGGDGDFLTAARNMYAGLQKGGADAFLTVWPGQGHGIWAAYYSDMRFYQWLMQHRRLTPQERALRDKGQLPQAGPFHYRHVFSGTDGKSAPMSYGLYLPKGYDPAKRWPLFVQICDDADRGHDLATVFNHGSDSDPRRDPQNQFAFPMLGLSPQGLEGKPWSHAANHAAVLALIDDIVQRFPIDQDRIYLGGAGSGLAAAYTMAANTPQRFAAIAAAQDVAPGQLAPLAPRLRGLAAALGVFSTDERMMQDARQTAALLRKAQVTNWTRVLDGSRAAPSWRPLYTEPRVVTWLLDQRRPDQAQQQLLQQIEQRQAALKLPQEPGHHDLEFPALVDGKVRSLKCRMYLPADYQKSPSWPLLLFLHGPEARGPDGLPWGPDLEAKRDPKRALPVISLTPYCPANGRWDDPHTLKAVVALLDFVAVRMRVDEERILAAGTTSGAASLWQLMLEAPDRFAGLALTTPQQPPDTASLRRRSAWLVALGDSADAGKELAEILRKAQVNVQLTVLAQGGLERWQTFYSDPKFWEWALRQRRR